MLINNFSRCYKYNQVNIFHSRVENKKASYTLDCDDHPNSMECVTLCPKCAEICTSNEPSEPVYSCPEYQEDEAKYVHKLGVYYFVSGFLFCIFMCVLCLWCIWVCCCRKSHRIGIGHGHPRRRMTIKSIFLLSSILTVCMCV